MVLLASRLDAGGSILVVVAAALVVAFWHTSAVVSGDYPRDVELIEPVTEAAGTTTTTMATTTTMTKKHRRGSYNNAFRHSVSYYPSYVKGEDPVEEYNRRRLHVDTSDYVKSAELAFSDDERRKLLEESLHSIRLKYAKQSDGNENKKKDKMVTSGKSSKKSKKRRKVRDPIKRRWSGESVGVANGSDLHALAAMAYPKRYEESDPDVFSYERSTDDNRREGGSLPKDTKYFQDTYCEQKSPLELEFGHLYETHDGWEERYERQDHKKHRHQGKVKWADKNGGFGEHYWDFNHV
ncbi:uncharacterized protein LOC135703370 [Ochlerotatus camptorhynchus]|uniref:uncharacterized protein LOC135703370 n=1 Tax=Ochlerotatus camptorhynchus TaxID=644619 RepID=UPI0031DBC65E